MNLLTESLWGDEGFSAIAVQKDFIPMIGVVMRDTAPPFFYLVGFIWGRLFGFSEVSLRSLTLLLMIGAAVFAGLIVHRIDRNRVNAILAFGLTLFAPFLFPFAFEWRMYALLTFTLTGSTYFFVCKKWLPYVVFSLMALYTHHFAVFTVFAQGIWFLATGVTWKKPKKWLGELRPFILIGLLYSLWLYPMYIQISRVKGSGFWLGKPDLDNLFDLLYRFATGGIDQKLRGVVTVLVVTSLVFKDWRRVGKNFVMLLFIFSAPIWLSYGLSQVITPIFYDRYLLSCLAGVAVLVSLGSGKVSRIIILGLLFLFMFSSFTAFTHPRKRPFRELANYVKTELVAGDEIINYNGRAHHLWETKYYGIGAPIYVSGEPLPLYVGTALMEESDMITTLPKPEGRLVVVASEPVESIKLPGFSFLESKQFGDLSVSWWKGVSK